MRYQALLLLALLLIVIAPAFPAVEIYDTQVSSYVPAYIDYRLNCAADVTIEIMPCDFHGTPTGPPVKTVTFTGQSRGFHRYIWVADRDDGTTAPAGYYAVRITATHNQAQWDPIIGLYVNSDYSHEYAPRPLPTVPDSEGFFGIGVNKDPNSDYYGRIYTSHKVQKDIFMYGPDGTYLGKFDDSAVNWSVSAPWDLAVADDGYVYVTDRSQMLCHCFSPDGTYVSTSPTLTNFRAIFARTASDGRTHIVYSGSTSVMEVIVEPDHATWTVPVTPSLYTPGTWSDTYGMWVSPDLRTIYQACISGTNAGLTRWIDPESDRTYVMDTSFTCGSIGACVDVDLVDPSAGSDYLWVTRMVTCANDNPTTTQNEYSRALHKVNLDTGSVTSYPYDVVSWGLMVSADAKGNPAVTFGKSTATWAQRYWGLFAEAGMSTSQKLLTTPLYYSPCMPPVVVPGSAVWTPDNTIAADDSDTASVSVKAMDVNGWADITSVTLDLRPLGYGSAVACTLTQDTSDPSGKTVIATKTGIKAKVGTRCTTSYGQLPHKLTATVRNIEGCQSYDLEEVQLNVTGDPMFDAYIKHRRVSNWYVQDARIVAVGGGIPGATDPRAQGPFTYTSALTDATGYASLELSAGTFAVKAQKTGFGSETPSAISVPYTGYTMDLYLRPLTIVEARATANGTKVNVEGICYAQPVGLPPTAAPGLASRTDTGALRNQWYVCDPNSPANGMLFMVTAQSPTFEPQWGDASDIDIWPPTYFGKRPEVGETTMITGVLDVPPGHERRVLIQDADLLNGLSAQPPNYDRIYLNRGNLGGLPSTPVTVSLSQVYHPETTGLFSTWGKYVQVDDVTVVKVVPAGDSDPSGGDVVPYVLVADAQGNSAQIAAQSPTTLNFDDWPSVGCTYSIRGAAGRTRRYGTGCIRIRGESDLTADSCAPIPPLSLEQIRSYPTGSAVNAYGIVTAKIGSSLWIGTANRSIGIRVMSNPVYIAVGDHVQVRGTLVVWDGERVIQPSMAIVHLSTGNPVPGALDMRTREVGGVGCLEDPGVSTGRGALNVGLKVHVQGMVTAIGSNWFYVWDGANRADAPVADGTGNLGVRIEAAPPSGSVPWQTWVDVTGMVSTDASLVAGQTAPTIIPILATKVTAFDTISTPVDQPLRESWNLIGLPAAPAGQSDGDEYSAKPWDPYMVLGPNQSPDDIDGRLYRWESCTGGLYIWDQWTEWGDVPSPFGGAVLGDGYWLESPDNWAVSYSGKNSSLDQWIGICEPGWVMLGHPKDHPTYLSDVQVHNGASVTPMYDAVLMDNWIDCTGFWWDNQTQGLVDIGIPDCWSSTDTLMPWHGYWFQVYRGDLALIVPETPTAP